jgi:hypothetical protein
LPVNLPLVISIMGSADALKVSLVEDDCAGCRSATLVGGASRWPRQRRTRRPA